MASVSVSVLGIAAAVYSLPLADGAPPALDFDDGGRVRLPAGSRCTHQAFSSWSVLSSITFRKDTREIVLAPASGAPTQDTTSYVAGSAAAFDTLRTAIIQLRPADLQLMDAGVRGVPKAVKAAPMAAANAVRSALVAPRAPAPSETAAAINAAAEAAMLLTQPTAEVATAASAPASAPPPMKCSTTPELLIVPAACSRTDDDGPSMEQVGALNAAAVSAHMQALPESSLAPAAAPAPKPAASVPAPAPAPAPSAAGDRAANRARRTDSSETAPPPRQPMTMSTSGTTGTSNKGKATPAPVASTQVSAATARRGSTADASTTAAAHRRADEFQFEDADETTAGAIKRVGSSSSSSQPATSLEMLRSRTVRARIATPDNKSAAPGVQGMRDAERPKVRPRHAATSIEEGVPMHAAPPASSKAAATTELVTSSKPKRAAAVVAASRTAAQARLEGTASPAGGDFDFDERDEPAAKRLTHTTAANANTKGQPGSTTAAKRRVDVVSIANSASSTAFEFDEDRDAGSSSRKRMVPDAPPAASKHSRPAPSSAAATPVVAASILSQVRQEAPTSRKLLPVTQAMAAPRGGSGARGELLPGLEPGKAKLQRKRELDTSDAGPEMHFLLAPADDPMPRDQPIAKRRRPDAKMAATSIDSDPEPVAPSPPGPPSQPPHKPGRQSAYLPTSCDIDHDNGMPAASGAPLLAVGRNATDEDVEMAGVASTRRKDSPAGGDGDADRDAEAARTPAALKHTLLWRLDNESGNGDASARSSPIGDANLVGARASSSLSALLGGIDAAAKSKPDFSPAWHEAPSNTAAAGSESADSLFDVVRAMVSTAEGMLAAMNAECEAASRKRAAQLRHDLMAAATATSKPAAKEATSLLTQLRAAAADVEQRVAAASAKLEHLRSHHSRMAAEVRKVVQRTAAALGDGTSADAPAMESADGFGRIRELRRALTKLPEAADRRLEGIRKELEAKAGSFSKQRKAAQRDTAQQVRSLLTSLVSKLGQEY